MVSVKEIQSQEKRYARALYKALHLSKHALKIITVTGVVSGLSFLVINATLFAIQITSLPLFLKVDQINLGLKTPGEAQVLLNSYGQAQQLTLSIHGQTHKTTISQVGIQLKTAAIMHTIQHPSGWNKIPLIYALNNRHRSFPLQYNVNSKTLNAYLAKLKLPPQQAAANASIVIPSNVSQQPYIVPEKIGYVYTAESTASQITDQVVNSKNFQITVEAQNLQPSVMAKQLTATLSKVNNLLDNNLTITNGVTSYKLTSSDLRKIVAVSEAGHSLPQPTIDRKQLVELLRAHSNIFYVAPTSSQVSTLDGNVVSKTEGGSGLAVNIDASANLIDEALNNGSSRQVLAMSSVGPTTTYLKDYTATSAGLAAYIKDFAANHSGSFQVATFELNDNRSAFYNQNAAVVPASTYKLFVAYAALKGIDQGTYSYSTQTSSGSLDYCMQKMIIVSDNDCAKAILSLVGWSQTETIIQNAGFGSTNVNNSGGGYMSSTANDIANLLKGFYNGSLLSTASTNYLFGLMKQQVYRSGIPAGSSGAVVADKVGFLEAWNHDAAIVYAPNSTYVLVILTTNSSFSTISALANGIYNLYNQ